MSNVCEKISSGAIGCAVNDVLECTPLSNLGGVARPDGTCSTSFALIGDRAPLGKKSTSMIGGSSLSTGDGWLVSLDNSYLYRTIRYRTVPYEVTLPDCESATQH